MTVIDEKVLKESIEKGLSKIATDVVPTIVDEKMEDIKKDVKEVKESMTEMVKGFKTWKKEDKTEVIEKTAKIFKALAKQDMAEVKTLSEWTDADGGFLVPEEFEKSLFLEIQKYWIARKYCRKYPMRTDIKNITGVDNTVVAYIVDEWTETTGSQPIFRRIKLEAVKIASLIAATSEIIDDNMSAQEVFNLVLNLVANKFAELEDTQVLTWDGTGSNFGGVLNIGQVYSLDTGKTSIKDVTADDIINMVYGLKDTYTRWKNPRFYVNKNILWFLRTLTDKNNVKLLVEDNNWNATMLGYEVITTDVLPWIADDAADKKFFFFGDLDFYALWVRKWVSSETGYTAWWFEKDVKSLKVIERIGGAALTAQAFVVLKTAAS